MLHDGWTKSTLQEVSRIKGGTTPSKDNNEYWLEGSICWATPTDITALSESSLYIKDTKHKTTKKALKETSLELIKPGNVLMTSRATIGYAVINQTPITVNQGFAVFFPIPERLEATFLVYWLRYKKPFLEQIAGGSTFLEISKKSLKTLEIDLPPLDEQKKIASVLYSVDAAIVANEALIGKSNKNGTLAALKSIKAGLMSDLLSGRVRVNGIREKQEAA